MGGKTSKECHNSETMTCTPISNISKDNLVFVPENGATYCFSIKEIITLYVIAAEMEKNHGRDVSKTKVINPYTKTFISPNTVALAIQKYIKENPASELTQKYKSLNSNLAPLNEAKRMLPTDPTGVLGGDASRVPRTEGRLNQPPQRVDLPRVEPLTNARRVPVPSRRLGPPQRLERHPKGSRNNPIDISNEKGDRSNPIILD